jgi:hypothetical protein
VAAIVPDDQGQTDRRYIVYYGRDNRVQYIDTRNAAYMPLAYALLFPDGRTGAPRIFATRLLRQWRGDACRPTRAGWCLGLTMGNGKTLTPAAFYAFNMFQREGESDHLARARRLFQEYACDAHSLVEEDKLTFLRFHQAQLRADTYAGVQASAAFLASAAAAQRSPSPRSPSPPSCRMPSSGVTPHRTSGALSSYRHRTWAAPGTTTSCTRTSWRLSPSWASPTCS